MSGLVMPKPSQPHRQPLPGEGVLAFPMSLPSRPGGSLGGPNGFRARRLVGVGVMVLCLTASLARLGAADLQLERDGEAMRLSLRGAEGAEYSVESVEVLLNGPNPNWKSVATVAPGSGPAFLYDPTCSTRPQNFYRLRLLQGTIPVELPNFRLLDLDGTAHELFYQSDARAVVILLTGPELTALTPAVSALHRIADRFGSPGVRYWIMATGTGADTARWTAQRTALGLDFPVLQDEAGVVTAQLGSGFAPEVVVVHPANWSVVYQGRITDPVSVAGGDREQPLLEDALARHLARERVIVRRTAPLGEAIPRANPPDLSYARDVAPILQKRCVSCHSPGNIAPWSMTHSAIVRDYAPLIKDEVLTRRMPPWHADRRAQAYGNDGMLDGEEVAILVDWVDRGAPHENGEDPLALAVPAPPSAWPLGNPDRVVSVPRQNIPASGTVDYRYLVVPNPFPGDVWLRAAVVKPGNRRVVHHVLVFSATSFSDVLQIQGGLGGYFAAYVPGMDQVEFPAGTGKLLKRGAFLVFQMHYTATGEPEADQTELGLYVAPVPPGRELRTAAAYTTLFNIPAGAADHEVTAEFVMPRDGLLYEMSPHMHYRGKRFRFEAVYPDQTRETLLSVPFYRFDWQTLYRLATPKRLPAGTRIQVTGAWDNSARNPYNPDPAAIVRFGEQSWEEMFIGYFNWSDAPPN